MVSKFYKYCAVPQCKSTTIKTPNKLFIHVPRTKTMRKTWLQLARRDPALVSTQSKMYFCEDHFDLANDMENYPEYHLMGTVSQIRLRAGCVPTKFACQPDRIRQTEDNTTRPLAVKRQRLESIAECKREIEQTHSTQSISVAEVQSGPSSDMLQLVSFSPITTDESIQVSLSHINEQIIKQEREEIVQMTIKKVRKRPRFYIGVPKNCYYLINIISKHTDIPEKYILLCLKKIRLHTKFSELADEFGMSASYACKIFLKNIPIICSVMCPFIVNLEKNSIKQCLPTAFRHRYHNVSCIIDCLEIEIQKPSNAVNQALTWSDDKKANTLKYLISSTPDGLVNYISPGYGGRTSDVCVVATCNFLNTLEKGSCILADRGFKHIEQMVLQAGLHLVRPPSLSTGSKLSKEEARQTKQIASLRIHIERVIRCLREFAMLKPHACINNDLIKVLDEVIIIACALINLQDSVIK